MGLHAHKKTLTRGAGSPETNAQAVPGRSTHPLDSRQLFAARNARGAPMVPTEQRAFDLDTDERILAQPNRMSVYPGQGIRDSQYRLHKSRRTGRRITKVRELSQPARETKKVIEPNWKRH